MESDTVCHSVSPTLAVWQRYEPTVKADLFSTAISTASGTFLVDPFPLSPNALSGYGIAGVIVTNSNHTRAADDFSRLFDAPIFARPDVGTDLASNVTEIADGERIAPGLEVITIEGAAPGEIALHSEAEDGTLILGDALINMGALGFDFLPSKYCTNSKLMRLSLRKLLSYPCARILFAHGTPIVSQAQRRLAELLNE